MAEVGRLSVKVDADTAAFHSGMAGVQQKLGQFGQGMKQFGGMMTRYVTMPLIGVGAAAFKMGKDFEFEMQKIVGLVGQSQEQVAAWSKEILEMAPALGKAPKELAEALYFVTSAGIDAADAMDVLEMSAKASAAGLGETKIIADLVTSAMNAYGVENLSAAHATDILVNAVRQGKAEPAELAASLGKVLPIAAEMGVTFEQVAAATAAMTRTGTDAQTAGTQLRAMMVSLLKPAAQAESALKNMGTSSAELRKQIREEGLLAGLMNLREMTNKFGEDAMAKVFPNIRALTGILDLMGENVEDNIKIFDSMNNVLGLTEDAFQGAANTAEFKFQQALANLQVSAIELWEVLEGPVVGVMSDIVEKIKELTDWFKNLDKEQQEQIVKWAGIALVAGPVLTVLGNLVIVVVALTSGISGLLVKLGVLKGAAGLAGAAGAAGTYSTAMLGTKGAVAATAAFDAKLVALAAKTGGIGLVIAALALVYIETKKMEEGWKEALEQGDIFFDHLGEMYDRETGEIIEDYKRFGVGMKDITIDFMGETYSNVAEGFEAISVVAEDYMDQIYRTHADKGRQIYETSEEYTDQMLRHHGKLAEVIPRETNEYMDAMLRAIRTKGGAAADSFDGTAARIIAQAKLMTQAVKEALKVIEATHSAGYNYVGDTVTSPTAPGWGGMFDSGGIVPGPIGKPQMALVHGGETILPTHKGGAAQQITVHANYNVTSKELAEYANTDLVKKFQGRGLGDAFR